MKWRKARKKPVEVKFRDVAYPFEEIKTLEGVLRAYPSKHYIIQGVRGEIYPIEKSIFHETYEELRE